MTGRPDLLPELFTRADARQVGVRLERPKGLLIQRLTHNVYTLGRTDDFETRVRAIGRSFSPDSVICGATALRLWGAELPQRLVSEDRVHVLRTERSFPTSRPDVLVHRGRLQLPPRSLNGICLADPSEAWLQIANDVSLDALVHVADALMRRQRPLVPLGDLVSAVEQSHRRPGLRRARVAVGLCRPGTDSWPETTTRLLLVKNCLPCPEVNLPVLDDTGRVIFYLDLAYQEQKVAIEYDGAYHVGDRAIMEQDRTRRRWLEDHGWRVISLTAADLRDPASVVRSVRLAISVLP